MMMNTLEQEDLIKGLPDDALIQYMQNPSGQLAQYLVASEIQHRTDTRKRFAAQEQQPEQTVAEQIVAEASPQQQGIAALPPQMPPQAPMGAMPPSMQMQQPQMPPQMMQQPQMSPEMMAAQMAPAAPQPQQVMMAGGGPIPGSIIEDASKFSPESLYDVDPVQQSAMANATNMGIPSVLPMAGGGVVRMQEGESVPYEIPLSFGRTVSSEDVPEWYRRRHEEGFRGRRSREEQFTDEEGNIDKAGLAKFMGRRALEAGVSLALPQYRAIRAFPSEVRKKGIEALIKPLSNLGKFARQRLGRNYRGERGRFLPDYESGIGLLREAGRYISPFRREFYTRTVPASVIAHQAAGRHIFGSPSEEENYIPGSITQEIIDRTNEDRIATKEETAAFLSGGLNQGGIVKMQNTGQVPILRLDDVLSHLEDLYLKPPELLNEVEGEYLTPDQAIGVRDYTASLQEIDPRLIPERREITPLEPSPPIDSTLPIDVSTAMDIGEEKGGMGLSAYQISEELQGLDTSTQEAEIQSQIDALEAMKGQTPDTFDITESVLRSGERADERAISQALINLGAGIAAGDISKGFTDAGTAVSGIRQRQEEFQQLADVRRAEAESKASSDRMTRDISITTAQIGAYGDLQDQQNAANQLLIQRENALIEANKTNNTQLQAQKQHEFDVTELAVAIGNFDRQFQFNMGREDDLNLRERMRYESAALRAFAPSVLSQEYQMQGPEKAAWKPTYLTMPDGTPDTRPGWTAQRALQDLLEGIRAGMPSEITQSDFDRLSGQTAADVTGFSLVGPGQ